MFKPCVIIPVYNHDEKILSITSKINAMGLFCYLLNDGSNPSCSQKLEQAANNSQVKLVSWAENRGKGAVVCDGILLAKAEGYSHALQVDADGQHDLDDVITLLTLAEQNRDSVVSAMRPYHLMPKNRRIGRKVTDIWVWVHTLSLTIKDSMCGFRVYPLTRTASLLNQMTICKRMDFDTDILVRLYWSGANVIHCQSHVNYEEDIPSHFNLVKDNIRISKMHTRLFFGMLAKIPRLVTRWFN